MSVQKWPCLQSGSAQRSGAAAPGQPRPENGGAAGAWGGVQDRPVGQLHHRDRDPDSWRQDEESSRSQVVTGLGPGAQDSKQWRQAAPHQEGLRAPAPSGVTGAPARPHALRSTPKKPGGCLPCVSMAATLPGHAPTARLSPWGRGGVHRAWPPPPGTGLPLVGTSRVAAPKPSFGLGLFPPGAGGQGREDPAGRVWTVQPSCRFSHCQDCPRLGGWWPGLGSPLCSGPACDSPTVGELGVTQSPGLTWSLTMDAGAPQAGPTGGCSG